MDIQGGGGGLAEILYEEMGHFLRSDRRQEMIAGEHYYQGRHEILSRKKTVPGPGGTPVECTHLLNSRVVDNQYARVVDQKVSYLLGMPITIETEKRAFLAPLNQLFGPDFRRRLRLVGEDALNCGIGWLHPCYDGKGVLRFRRIAPWEVLPFWADDAHCVLEGALRVYTRERGGGLPGETVAELFTPEGLYRFSAGDGRLRLEEGFQPYFSCRCGGSPGSGPVCPWCPFGPGPGRFH